MGGGPKRRLLTKGPAAPAGPRQATGRGASAKAKAKATVKAPRAQAAPAARRMGARARGRGRGRGRGVSSSVLEEPVEEDEDAADLFAEFGLPASAADDVVEIEPEEDDDEEEGEEEEEEGCAAEEEEEDEAGADEQEDGDAEEEEQQVAARKKLSRKAGKGDPDLRCHGCLKSKNKDLNQKCGYLSKKHLCLGDGEARGHNFGEPFPKTPPMLLHVL